MNTKTRMQQVVAVSAAVLFMAVSMGLAQAAESAKSPAMESNSTAIGSTVASGAVEDTLKACLARIPKDASSGQRMMAELSCQRDEGTRAPFQMGTGR